jgi:hypothetical protein
MIFASDFLFPPFQAVPKSFDDLHVGEVNSGLAASLPNATLEDGSVLKGEPVQASAPHFSQSSHAAHSFYIKRVKRRALQQRFR